MKFPGLVQWGRGVIHHFLLMGSSALLFTAAFPNSLFKEGLPLLAFVAYIPIFILIQEISLPVSVLWGALYGYLSYALFNYWLSVFHPLAGIVVGVIYLTYFAILFPLLKLSEYLFPKKYYILQWLLWLSYEYLRTKGFLGYAYGITGYSQWNMGPLIQIADIGGVWLVSALVVFPSVYLAALYGRWNKERSAFKIGKDVGAAVAWVLALIATLVYGYMRPLNYTGAPVKRLALIQHNADPWRGGLPAYRRNFEVLKRLSLEAIQQEPSLDLVVWSETAFVPRIYWHTTYRDDPESYVLVKELLDFLATQSVPYVIGNDDARLEVNEEGRWERVDYNAVMLFEKGEEQGIYRKIHLVPFTEHFPYKKQLPWVYEALRNADTHFWKKGTEYTVFESSGLRFATPICFEDTFGYLSREFVRRGAEIIVNLTNDAWAHSLACQMQHATMAVFRAVENRRSVVRATASGQTCAIDPNGKITAMGEPFTETYLIAAVPLVSEATLYTAWGDWAAYLFVGAALGGLLLGLVREGHRFLTSSFRRRKIES